MVKSGKLKLNMPKDSKKSTKDTERFVRKQYRNQLMEFKPYFIAPVSMVIAGVISANIIPIFFSDFIEKTTNGVYSSYSALVKPLLILLSLYVLKFLFQSLNSFFWAKTIHKSEKVLYISSLKTLNRHSKAFFADNFSGGLLNKLTVFSSKFQDLLVYYDTLLFPQVASICFIVVYLGFKSPLLLIPFAFTAAIFGVLVFTTKKKRVEISLAHQSARSDFQGKLADSLASIEVIKSEGMEELEYRTIGVSLNKWSDGKKSLNLYSMNTARVVMLVNSLLTLFSIAFAAGLFIHGDVGIGTVILMSFYAQSLTNNIEGITNYRLNVQRSLSDASGMAEIMLMEPEIKDPENPVKLKITKGEIKFNGASFKYTNSSEEVKEGEDSPSLKSKDLKEEQHLFQDLNLTIQPGERIGLVGPSGGGKSTLLKLILRFYDVDSGEIQIDGVNIKDVVQSKLRQQIAYVPQDPALFHRSIGENIGYSKPKASQARIETAAKQAYADEFIEKLPKGYETLVGERGVKLSGGQRQRVAIARAILKDAPILLLDEATSALDSESEKYIQKSLEKLMKGRTTVVVAHRLSTIQKMDRILVIDDGRVVASGTHSELLESSPLYKRLWSHQSGGMLKD